MPICTLNCTDSAASSHKFSVERTDVTVIVQQLVFAESRQYVCRARAHVKTAVSQGGANVEDSDAWIRTDALLNFVSGFFKDFHSMQIDTCWFGSVLL